MTIFAQTIPFFVLCFITNIYNTILQLQYFQIHKRYVTFLIMLFVYFLCQGRSFMLTTIGTLVMQPPCYLYKYTSEVSLLYQLRKLNCDNFASLRFPLIKKRREREKSYKNIGTMVMQPPCYLYEYTSEVS